MLFKILQMKSILKQAQQVFYIKEEFKAIFSRKSVEKKNENKAVSKDKLPELEEKLMEV